MPSSQPFFQQKEPPNWLAVFGKSLAGTSAMECLPREMIDPFVSGLGFESIGLLPSSIDSLLFPGVGSKLLGENRGVHVAAACNESGS